MIPPPPNTAGSVATRKQLIDAVNAVRSQLQASALLELPQLEPFETELNYLLYPVGGHYKRHLDVPYYDDGWVRQGRRASDGGSFSGGSTRRVISFILYLNRDWDGETDGGCLRVYPKYQRVYGSEAWETLPNGVERPIGPAQLALHAEDVTPHGGSLVLLMSGDVEHLVRETHRERQCVVGWFRERREQAVPDLATKSLRTLRLLDRKTTDASCRGLSGRGSLWS